MNKKKKLPSTLKIDLFDMLDRNTQERVWEDINEYLCDHYGQVPSIIGIDSMVEMNLQE